MGNTNSGILETIISDVASHKERGVLLMGTGNKYIEAGLNLLEGVVSTVDSIQSERESFEDRSKNIVGVEIVGGNIVTKEEISRSSNGDIALNIGSHNLSSRKMVKCRKRMKKAVGSGTNDRLEEQNVCLVSNADHPHEERSALSKRKTWDTDLIMEDNDIGLKRSSLVGQLILRTQNIK